MRAADVGAGLGYFTFPMAVQVRSQGHVVAVDPSPAAREELQRRLESAAVHNVVVRDGTASATGIGDHSMDRVLWHALFHEIPDLVEAVGEMHRILRPHGLFVVVDWRPGATEIGPGDHERWKRQAAVELVVNSGGFRMMEEFEPGPVTWGVVFERE